jgi:hypothetical protein
MDSQRVKANALDWTIPSSHLKFGEDPVPAFPSNNRSVILNADNRPALNRGI